MDSAESVKTCPVSYFREMMQVICLKHAQTLLKTYWRSFRKKSSGRWDTTLLWVSITFSLANLRVAVLSVVFVIMRALTTLMTAEHLYGAGAPLFLT